uniref:RNA-dependent RNA polymerase n=1 Tax=Kalmanozyma brasiliensis (strain GHG001) TaxID=1365824 RepID=V5GK27_KALBG
MLKFSSGHQDLEVANSSSRCLSAKLNRPLINALDDRGVNKDAFLDIQDEAMRQIDRARTRFNETAKLCSAFSLGTGCNLRTLFEKCHKAGLGAATVEDDSFLLVLAKAVTAAAFGDMKRKARIPVKGVTLLGIADEFSFLKEGEAFAQVETVELGGGDLDGDLYTIYEDERLFPQTRQPPGVFHDKVKELTLNIDCGPHQLAEFFADFMLNDFIGLVSHLHLRIADISELGSEDPRCKKLARLHSQATDFRKTGVAVARTDLPRMQDPIIPDFLVQSEEKREGKLTYASKRVLGHLYRAVSWDMTDTPSLDKNTDPETGLERVIDEEPPEMDDDELTEFGAEFNRLAEQQSQGLISSARATPSPPPAPMLPAQDEFIRLDAGDDDAATVAEEDEGEEGELTAASAQNTVDSLWKACHFFCSPDRPRYSNVYGYNTFMITLTLHMLSMLETLKHLSRDQGGKRYYQRPRAVTPTPQNPEVKTEEDGFEEEEDYAEEDEMEYEQDPNYSLTEEAMRALNLGQAILADMPPNQLGFDG